MLLPRIQLHSRHLIKKVTFLRPCSTSPTTTSESEYVDTPQYPPILELGYKKDKERKKISLCEEIKAVKTVEEKQIKLNMPRYFGFKCYMFKEDEIPYDNLDMVQHVTKTHFMEQEDLPEFYSTLATDVDLSSLKSAIEDMLIMEYSGYKKWYEVQNKQLDPKELENETSSTITKALNRLIVNHLSETFPHIRDTMVDIEPRVEAAWYAGKMVPPTNVRKMRLGQPWQKDFADDPVDRAFQYLGTPLLQLRSQLPLAPLIDYNQAENDDYVVPNFPCDPRTVGLHCDYRRLVNLPGFFPGDPYKFGLLSFHGRGHLVERNYPDSRDPQWAIHRQGLLGSYGWLLGQANYLGFNVFNDILYPLVNQCVVTNIKFWSFYSYQLNTMSIHLTDLPENNKRNFCWGTKPMQLFGDVTEGRVIDFNEDVLKMLLKFYANKPAARQGVDMTPYLSKQEKLAADYKDDEKTAWLEREYKFITSNRPRLQLPYEVHHWEKIYKIDHKKRPMDARRRPFELSQNPWRRRYDERKPAYIPRKHRPDVKRHIGRDAKEFFP